MSKKPKKSYGFEAEPTNYKEAKGWHKKNENINVYHYAVTDFTGKTTLYVQPSKKSSHSVKKYNNAHLECEVNCTRLDDWAVSEKVKKIDFIKTDTQGSDYEVLDGCGDLLDTVKLTLIEVWFMEGSYKETKLFDEVVKIMNDHGLSLYCLKKIKLNNKDDSMRWGEACFYRKKDFPKFKPVVSKRVKEWLKEKGLKKW